MTTFVVDTGVANIASVRAAFSRLGVDTRTTQSSVDVENAEFLVLPGVGSFGAGMQALRELGLVEPLRERIEARLPTLCICLGMQLLAESSDEDRGVEGLRVLDCRVTRLPAGVRSPQMGWNQVGDGPNSGFAYFANSFALSQPPSGWECEIAVHGRPFPAMIRNGGVVACQFHPELSGAWGESLIADWLGVEARKEPEFARGPARLIPCLDVRDGRVVKGVKFQGLRDAGDPIDCAQRYERAGADELVVLDVAATAEGRGARKSLIGSLRRVLRIPLCVGGGLRSVDDAAELLEAGADKVAVNTAAVLDPELIGRLSARFGRQCVVVSIDAVKDGDRWRVVIRAGTDRTSLDVIEFAQRAENLGAGEILLTSFDRDGTDKKYDLALIQAVRSVVGVPVVASGGAGGVSHMTQALAAGADAVLAASIFHDEDQDIAGVQAALRAGAPAC